MPFAVAPSARARQDTSLHDWEVRFSSMLMWYTSIRRLDRSAAISLSAIEFRRSGPLAMYERACLVPAPSSSSSVGFLFDSCVSSVYRDSQSSTMLETSLEIMLVSALLRWFRVLRSWRVRVGLPRIMLVSTRTRCESVGDPVSLRQRGLP